MAETSYFSSPNNSEDDVSQGLESMSLGESENEEVTNEEADGVGLEHVYHVDKVEDLGCIVFHELTPKELWSYKFASHELAYDFFNEYAKATGFSLRKNKVGRSRTNGAILWRSFVCSREGLRDEKFINNPNRQREARSNTRCDCKAEYKVHIGEDGSRWYVSSLNIEHNHELLIDKFLGRLPSHRRMTDADVAEMNSMRKVGISTPKIFGAFAQQSGGYGNVRFNKKKMYNELSKERKRQNGDARAAISHLTEKASTEPKMYWSHEVDGEGKLRHLFWCDGDAVVDYGVFGDVLSFDATYGRNKYKCPVVVFSGVNHHRQTVVFACAVVSDETEQTYVWMLEHFLDAMEGKHPKTVITYDNMAMRNAIVRVFPAAHHRLCGWHLCRNASTDVGKKNFQKGFKKCMFYDYEVEEFERKWREVVVSNGVEGVTWVQDIYAKKNMWVAAYMKGKFFAGLRTTSRCEGFHTQIGKYVGSGDSLYEFIQHFERCLSYVRNNEVEADFRSCFGVPVMQTSLPSLEMSAANLYSRDIFVLFREKLWELASVRVMGKRQTASSVIYVVSKYRNAPVIKEWHVLPYPTDDEWRCSCKGMESSGIPCVHILAVIVHLHIHELPKSLILRRWCKNAKEGLEQKDDMGNTSNASSKNTRFAALQHQCRRLCSLACRSLEDFNQVCEKVNAEIELLLKNGGSVGALGSTSGVDCEENVRDLVCVRTKGCGPSSVARDRTSKKPRRCTTCRSEGHNKRRCPESQDNEAGPSAVFEDSNLDEDANGLGNDGVEVDDSDSDSE